MVAADINGPDLAPANLPAADTTNIVLAFKDTAGNDLTPATTTEWTNKDINAFAFFSISGNDTTLPNAKTRITIPKENITGTTDARVAGWTGGMRPDFSAPSLPGATYRIYEDANNWYAEYSFPTLAGGQEMAVPFTFKFSTSTPNGYQKPITFDIIDEAGTTLKSTTTISGQPRHILFPQKKLCEQMALVVIS